MVILVHFLKVTITFETTNNYFGVKCLPWYIFVRAYILKALVQLVAFGNVLISS